MSAIVVDTSVGIKWFVPEVHAAEARQWQNGPDELHVPAFFFDLEIANILWKKMQRAEITRADADSILGQLPALPVTRHPEAPLLASAFDMPFTVSEPSTIASTSLWQCIWAAEW